MMRESSAEIAQLEHELAILRQRHSNFARSARLLRLVWIVACVAILGGVAYGIATDNMLGTVAAFVFFIGALATGVMHYDRRPIDIVSQVGSWPPQRSEALAVEEMIAERERRLT